MRMKMGKRSFEGWYEKDGSVVPFKLEIILDESTGKFIGDSLEESEFKEAKILCGFFNGNEVSFLKEYFQKGLCLVRYNFRKKVKEEFSGSWHTYTVDEGDELVIVSRGKAGLAFIQ